MQEVSVRLRGHRAECRSSIPALNGLLVKFCGENAWGGVFGREHAVFVDRSSEARALVLKDGGAVCLYVPPEQYVFYSIRLFPNITLAAACKECRSNADPDTEPEHTVESPSEVQIF